MREPVVFRGVAAHWPALQRWVPERLAEMAGDRMVEVVVGDREGGAPVFESMPLRAFFTRWPEADESGAPALYLKEFNLLDALPRLAEDVDFSPYERPGATCWHDAWVSQAGGRTNLRSDLLDNTLTQIVGRKRVTLISPAWSADVYPSPKFDPYARLSLVDAFAPDFARFPRYRTALTHELQVVLEPGDAVYIPRGWWHTAQSLSASISIAGFWETRWARATVMLLEDVRRALHRVGVYKRGHCTCHPAAGQRSAA
ncbi:MAG: cupin-like domain-containing protein [Myxococcales bacterium]|nr:cupin-like domain-containing protein [Myxococcales bacterium]